MTIEIPGWPANNAVFQVKSLDLSFLPGEHPYYLAHAAEIDANWEREVAANPHLFNGRMVLQETLTADGGAIVGEAYEIPYSTFLYWRRQPDPAEGFHLFGFAVLVSSDGALVAIRMGAHTANPGIVYCAGGSLDLLDIVDGKLDVLGNMRWEVQEETGLDLDEAVADPRLFASRSDRRVCVFRFHRFDLTADEIVARIEANMVHDPEQEIAGAVVIRTADRQAQPYAPVMFPILDFFFGNETH